MFALCLLFAGLGAALRAQQPQKLGINTGQSVDGSPAPGNGRLGAMVFGGVNNELIQLNEGTLWTGGPARTHVNPDAYKNLLLAREALLKRRRLRQSL